MLSVHTELVSTLLEWVRKGRGSRAASKQGWQQEGSLVAALQLSSSTTIAQIRAPPPWREKKNAEKRVFWGR